MNKIIQTEFNNPPASILDFRKIMITVICLTIIGPLLQSIDASFSNIASNDAFLHQVSWSIIVMKFISDTVIHFFVSFIFLSPLLIINMSGGISCLLLLALFRSIMNKKAPNFTRSLLALYFIISFVYLVNNHYLMINPVSFTQYGFSSWLHIITPTVTILLASFALYFSLTKESREWISLGERETLNK